MPVTLNEISTTDKYAFNAEWFDIEASILRKFYFFYFPFDGTIEMYDQQRNKRFLKRTSVEGIEASDIYVGNTIKIFNRQVKLTDYGNIYTKKKLGEAMQKTCIILKPDGVKNMSKIITAILKAGFKICNLRMLTLTSKMMKEIFSNQIPSSEFQSLSDFLVSGPVLAMQLIGENAVKKFQELAGENNPKDAVNASPDSLRSLYGIDSVQNVLHCPSSTYEADAVNDYLLNLIDLLSSDRETEITSINFPSATSENECLTMIVKLWFNSDELSDYFFGESPPPATSDTSTIVLKDSSCCIIKPHAVRNGHLGDILCKIEDEGFIINAIQMFYVDHVTAEEFYEVYKGVSQEFSEMVTELASGACVAMEVTGPMGKETPQYFRTLVGPADPDMARQLRPNTLRAIFGEDKIKNGLHVTDLPEDGVLEVEYFFRILT